MSMLEQMKVSASVKMSRRDARKMIIADSLPGRGLPLRLKESRGDGYQDVEGGTRATSTENELHEHHEPLPQVLRATMASTLSHCWER